MPIFHQDLERRDPARDQDMPPPPTPYRQPDQEEIPDHRDTLIRSHSEESLRTELCEGPVTETSPPPKAQDEEAGATCSDRSELIERLKRGESPTWIPNRHLESIWNQRPVTPTRRSTTPNRDSPSLLPAPRITPERQDPDTDNDRWAREGLSIERPRSALHSGNFSQDGSSEEGSQAKKTQHDRFKSIVRSDSQPWLATSPPRPDFSPWNIERVPSHPEFTEEPFPGVSSLSSSLSSSFYQPPTSPLVQSETNDDIDLASPLNGIDLGSGVSKNLRRHSLMSNHPGAYSASSPYSTQRQVPSLRHERTYPYQAHQPRRSLTSTPNFSLTGTSPQTPALRSRRPSYSSDSSPIHHASMVGSYEESILRGRMSTTPSKPLDFVAQIGVLGLGKCKSSLRCPPHVTLPFPAVFYSYASSSYGRTKNEDGPSPYVGQIDLENGLLNSDEEARSKRKVTSRAHDRKIAEVEAEAEAITVNDQQAETAGRDPRRTQRPKKRSGSPRAPPGGSYRIPEKGQIQIIIKNPNKTAVKLFLVPYDLAGMEPGTKTFIRQRSYSAGPILDVLPEIQGTGIPDRPILRYLVHLHICCPSRGRHYLYKSIRVVFANRVPDGKEKLRNEITLPEPRFTAYKPIRVMHPPTTAGSGPGAHLAAEKAFRRRSSGFHFGNSGQAFDAPDHLAPEPPLTQYHSSFDSLRFSRSNDLVEHVPFQLHNRQIQDTQVGQNISASDVWPPDFSQTSRSVAQGSGSGSNSGGPVAQVGAYQKLNKGDVGYGGNPFSELINGSPGRAEGLLSQRLRSLGVQAPSMEDDCSESMEE